MLSDLYIRLRSIFRRAKVEEELDDELRFHQQQQADTYMRAGMSREEALRRVRLDFGGHEQVKEDVRNARGAAGVENMMRDARYAVRQLRDNPAFAMVMILTLALAIGANSAIFSVILRSRILGSAPKRVRQR